jgi:hypothetical protein
MDTFMGARIGVIVHCEGGYLQVPDYNRAIAFDKEGKEMQRFEGSTSHFENFIEAMRSRNESDLNADIREGHLSSAMCHMGNVSHLLGAAKSREEINASLKVNAAAKETYDRLCTHLEANEIDAKAANLSMGPWINMDPKTERFVDDDAANGFLAREYREGFVVPSEV